LATFFTVTASSQDAGIDQHVNESIFAGATAPSTILVQVVPDETDAVTEGEQAIQCANLLNHNDCQ
jgi:hypothetical protein